MVAGCFSLVCAGLEVPVLKSGTLCRGYSKGSIELQPITATWGALDSLCPESSKQEKESSSWQGPCQQDDAGMSLDNGDREEHVWDLVTHLDTPLSNCACEQTSTATPTCEGHNYQGLGHLRCGSLPQVSH